MTDADTGRIAKYYGAADTYVSIAYVQMEYLVEYIKANSELVAGDGEERCMRQKITFMIPSKERNDTYTRSIFDGVLRQCDVKRYGFEVAALDKGPIPEFDIRSRDTNCVILTGFTIDQEKRACDWLKKKDMPFIVVNGENASQKAMNKVVANCREPFRKIK